MVAGQVTIGQRVRHIIGDSFGADIVENTLEKAIQNIRESAADPKTSFYDPMSMFMGKEWATKGGPLNLGYYDLRRMAKNPIIGSIIQTRLNQMASFMKPQENHFDPGFVVKPKIEEEGGSGVIHKEALEITAWLTGAGIPGYGETSLDTFSRKFMRDSLEMDQACAEISYRMNKLPAYMVGIDSATIRKTNASLNYATPENDDEILYVQILQDVIVTEYTGRDLMFGIRNPLSDMQQAGYGFSELEMLVRTVTTIINADQYNSGQLQQGGTSKGILVVKGEANGPEFASFKRDFRESIRNAAAFWRPPVLQVSKDADIDWVTLDRSQKDMEYAQLFDFLVKQSCGVYQIEPSEINWQVGASGASTTFESRNDTKLKHSMEKGLRPLLDFFAGQINQNIIDRIDPRFKLEFKGLGLDRELDGKIRKQETETYKTINEQRRELGMEDIDGGNIILAAEFMTASGMSEPKDEDNGVEVDLGKEVFGLEN